MRFAASSPQIASFITGSPRFDDMASLSLQAQGHEQNMAHRSEAHVSTAGLDAMAKVNSAQHQARGIVAQGKAAGEASQAQGMSGMMSGIAGGIGNMSFGGGGGGGYNTSGFDSAVSSGFGNFFG